MDKKTKKIICTAYCNGKKHDFKLFKDSKIRLDSQLLVMTDTGYQGIKKIHENSLHPKKRFKKRPLTKEDRKQNKIIASERITNEHVIGKIKRFKIIADRYRNRRKRFGLRFNLISGICNYEL